MGGPSWARWRRVARGRGSASEWLAPYRLRQMIGRRGRGDRRRGWRVGGERDGLVVVLQFQLGAIEQPVLRLPWGDLHP